MYLFRRCNTRDIGVKSHNFDTIKSKKKSTKTGVTWPVCKRCGLILLRNKASDKAFRKPCGGLDDEG